jgi:hypothetical protein
MPAAACAGGPVKRNAELFFPAEFADDFPVSLQVRMTVTQLQLQLQ